MKVESFSIGNSHYDNEDRLVIQELGGSGLVAILADGMGGLSLGDMAADVVTKSVAAYIKSNYQGSDELKILHDSLNYADQELRKVSLANKSNMGAAVAVALVHDHHLYCTWQGNVRIYVCHHSELSLVTKDHIANIGYGRTALTRCIKGAGLREDVPFVHHELNDGDMVFLCTDGLYNVAESHLVDFTVDELKQIGYSEDDATLIKIIIK
ncbi:MAG: protein phosphatase 2C domain-containing protein [Bacteroidales bacterium]|nr:protein phosphatase 2C domain-containing protein [Bacteroidales bacterium]